MNSLLIDQIDLFRLDAGLKLDPKRRSDLGQFMTPPATARLMASAFTAKQESIALLDAGAGVGSLTAAFVSEICNRSQKPKRIHATAYEIDPSLADYLSDTLGQCERTCNAVGIEFQSELVRRDFIDDGIRMLRQQMFALFSTRLTKRLAAIPRRARCFETSVSKHPTSILVSYRSQLCSWQTVVSW